APSCALLSLLRPLHRAHQPGAPDRRGAARRALRAGDRDPAAPGARRRLPALARRPPVPQSPSRRLRQHPPRRDLHRQALCAGRLGLVGFRAFEMPPHPRMSLAQQLLLRALIARFWDEPYMGALVRWGTRLHDAFMLPHVVWSDLSAVLDELNRAGFGLDPAW